MEDLGEPEETQIDFFRCVEKLHTPLPSISPPSLSHHSLLAISSKYGYLFCAARAQIHVYSLETLRKEYSSPTPHVSVDLNSYGVSIILSIALVLRDSALLARVREGNTSGVRILSTAGVVAGKAKWDGGIDAGGRDVLSVGVGYGEDREKIALLKAGGDVEVCPLQEGVGVKGSTLDEEALKQEVALCVAISPEEELVAVGTESGSVYLYDADTLERRMEIVVVESGWLPFSLAFLTWEDIMVSYACEDMINHVVWTIGEDQRGAMVTTGHSTLGELCYPALSSLSNSEDEAEHGEKFDEKGTTKPIMFCCPVPGWNICAVASSLSSDIEVIAKEDDGKWKNWKFDEGKSAVLPTDDNDYDTKPLGIALDMTDTEPIDALDPSASKINPMPRLISLTTASKFVPFALVDDRPDATCEYVKEPQPLPLLQKEDEVAHVPPASSIMFKAEGTQNIAGMKPTESKQPNLFGFSYSSTGNSNIKRGAMFESNFMHGFGFGKQEPKNVFSAPVESVASSGRQSENLGLRPGFAYDTQTRRTEEESISSDEGSGEDSDVDDGNIHRARSATEDEDSEQGSVESTTAKSPFPTFGHAFSGTENFLSNFEFMGVSSDQHGLSRGVLPRASTSSMPFGLNTGFSSQSKKSTSVNVEPVELPSYPPHPSFEEVSAAVSEGKPEDLIRSALIEMRQELDYNRKALDVMKRRLDVADDALKPQVENVKRDLSSALSDMREHFRQEAALRRNAFVSLKEIMLRSKEFETTSLEFRIREDEKFAQDIRPEDRAVDEQISKKENALAKSLSSVENRLHAERASRDRHESQTERIQRMYSSLSLQGIRIKRVCGFLSALAARVDELEKGGRRSDLGLSVARLERLSLGGSGKTYHAGSDLNDPPTVQSFHAGVGEDLKSPNQNLHVRDIEEEAFTASKEVLTVLRRLAMRGGRANITAKSSKSQFEKSKAESRKTNSKGIDGTGLRQANFERDTGHRSRVSNPSSNIELPHQEPAGAFNLTSTPQQETATFTDSENKRRRQPNGEHVKSPSPFSESSPFPFPRTDSDSSSVNFSSADAKSMKHSFAARTKRNGNFRGIDEEDATARLSKPKLLGNGKEVRFTFGLNESRITEMNNDSEKYLNVQKRVKPMTQSQHNLSTFTKEHFSANDLTASLPPDDFTMKSHGTDVPLDQYVKSMSAVTAAKEGVVQSGSETMLPPDGTKTNLAAASQPRKGVKSSTSIPLPPEENIKSSISVPLPPEEDIKRSFSAPLPQNDTVKSGVAAPLPPDGNLKKYPATASSTDVDSKPNLTAPLPPDELEDNKNTTIIPEGSMSESLFDAAPRTNSTKENSFAALPPDSVKNDMPNFTTDSNDAFGLGTSSIQFGKFEGSRQLNSSNALSQKNAAINQPDAKHSENKSSFGSASGNLSFSAPSTVFGLAQAQKSVNKSEREENISDVNRSSSDDSEKEDKRQIHSGFSMDTSSQGLQNRFGEFSASETFLSGQEQTSGIFGATFGQNTSSKGFGQSLTSNFSGLSNAQNDHMHDGRARLFGSPRPQAWPQSPFPTAAASTSAFGSTEGTFGSGFGTGVQFGQSSQIGGASFSTPAASGGGSQFGMNNGFGGRSKFGASSQIGAGFGASSQLGATSPFNTPSGSGESTAFGSAVQPFGGGLPRATFGVSSFGSNQPGQQPFGGGGSSFGGGNPSPFGSMTGSLFGGQSSGGSAFAALAASPGVFGGTANSGFGNSGAPVFGTNNGPPAFTSPAFSERRA